MPPSSRDDVDPRLIDGVLALAMALAVAVTIAADFEGAGRSGPVAYLFALAFGGLVAVRRLAPRTMLVLTVLGIFGYYALGFPVIGMALPAVAALYSAAELGRTWWAVGAGAVLVGVSSYFRIIEGQPTAYLYGYELATNVALIAAAIALGVAVRLTRETRERARQIATLTAAEQASAAEQRLQAERVRIARDLHDVVGHSLSVISVHSGVASEAVGRDDAAARQALERVREATSETLRELRATVKVLRTPGTEEPARGAAGLAGIDTLVRSAEDAGLRVELDVDVPAGSVDAAIDAAAYRIVQESLTNVLRHSGARVAEVSARVEGDRVRLRIADDGAGSTPLRRTDGRAVAPPEAPGGRGQGIAGMRERATMLGGSLDAGGGPDAGFVVAADLPRRLDT
ncbi:sensor histidine kinase [Georgenia halophila]|uniref:sensor histidine kinase n=1 Tax=Georgenia halophila TaxID=620889 RepID=UPI0031ECB85E